MSPEKEKQLTQKYPFMFRGQYMSVQENLMPFGFECGDGWFNILDQLCYSIECIRNEDLEKGEEWAKEFIVTQVKEKYGGLRFYISPAPESVHELTQFAEGLSLVTCEDCGAPGEVRNLGWIYTRCEPCLAELMKTR